LFTEPISLLKDFIDMLTSIPQMISKIGFFGAAKELLGFGGEPIKVEALEKKGIRTAIAPQAAKPVVPQGVKNEFNGVMDINIKDKGKNVESARTSSLFGNLDLGVSGVGV
jgi:hypothetical protein